jgi:hypothetical protein
MLGVGLYLVPALVPALFRELRMTDLVLANSVQLTAHALVMLWLTHRVGSLRGRGLEMTLLKALSAALVMGWLAFVTARWMTLRFPGQALFHELTVVGAASGVGLAIYGVLITLLRVDEVGTLVGMIRRRVIQ